jgi:hypothetical protein
MTTTKAMKTPTHESILVDGASRASLRVQTAAAPVA